MSTFPRPAAPTATSVTRSKALVAGLIADHGADLIGLQEALADQIADLTQRLPNYGWFGVGRDDGRTQGEHTAIFYNRDRFRVEDQATFWCSDTPEQPGLGWDADCPRTVTWGRLRDQVDKRAVYLFNTHFDHRGVEAQVQTARLLLARVKAIGPAEPVLMTGDLNCFPNSKPYWLLADSGWLFDARQQSESGRTGPAKTFTNFERSATPDVPIDYIFVGRGIRVLRHATLTDRSGPRLPSDHYPLLAEIILPAAGDEPQSLSG